MKKVILGSDYDRVIFSVPDEVADNLRDYCMGFLEWIYNSPEAERFRTGDGVAYSECDFIDYLNDYKFTNEKSNFIEVLECEPDEIPVEYEEYPIFVF